LRNMSNSDYKKFKEQNFAKYMSSVCSANHKTAPSIFIPDGCRRRTTMAFEYCKGQLRLGFNQKSSHQIVDIISCCLLTPQINTALPLLRTMLLQLCQIVWNQKKGKKLITNQITKGDIFICQADNGLDIVLEVDTTLNLEHRLIISEHFNKIPSVIRISHRTSAFSPCETIIEKSRPIVKMGKFDVYIPAGTFLQPSAEGQEALGNLVAGYLKDINGTISDLFCGVGTFSYYLASVSDTNIIAIDSSSELLDGFQNSINTNQLTNITIQNKNLFKYPPTPDELKQFSAIVFDPPRAGAKLLCSNIANSPYKPDVVVAVSCNPATFVNDANSLLKGGYCLQEITMIDQFAYSNHSELVAIFTKK